MIANARSFNPHVTVAAVAEDRGRFLVVREYVGGIEKLNNPAGHLEDGESLLDAVVREVHEETGYRFAPEAFGGVYVWRSPSNDTFVRFNFVGRCAERDPAARLDAGIIEPVWLAIEELEARSAMLRSPLVLQSFREHLAGVRYPLAAIGAIREA